MEDGEATQLVQQGVVRDADQHSYVALGGTGTEGCDNLLDEVLIRSFWRGYRAMMRL